MDEVLTLIKRTWNGAVREETTRDVFCELRSIGMREFYEANAKDFHPEAKFILADYLDYDGETLCQHNGTLYRILRTYRIGMALEITVERAPAKEAVL